MVEYETVVTYNKPMVVQPMPAMQPVAVAQPVQGYETMGTPVYLGAPQTTIVHNTVIVDDCCGCGRYGCGGCGYGEGMGDGTMMGMLAGGLIGMEVGMAMADPYPTVIMW